MDLNGNIKIGLKGIETASFWRIRAMIEIARKHWYVKKWKKIELHPVGGSQSRAMEEIAKKHFCHIFFFFIVFVQSPPTSGVAYLLHTVAPGIFQSDRDIVSKKVY